MTPRRDPAPAPRADLPRGEVRLVPDPDREGAWTLTVAGTPQSHVDLGDPTHLGFEYVRWLGHLLDLRAAPGEPLGVLHLGGGAWTLARYVAATRPGSRQRVVEVDAALVDFVRAHLPSTGSGIRVRVGEAREVLEGLGEDSVDVLVLDVFDGATTPAHLTSTEFVGHAARVLRPAGCYAANVADGSGLAFARSQVATLATGFTHVAVVAEPSVLKGRRFGNLLALGSQSPLALDDLVRRTAGEAFPARVLQGEALTRFVAGTRPTTDITATGSPSPPDGLFARPRRA